MSKLISIEFCEPEHSSRVVVKTNGETTPFEIEFTLGRDTDLMHVVASDGVSPLEWRKPGSGDES